MRYPTGSPRRLPAASCLLFLGALFAPRMAAQEVVPISLQPLRFNLRVEQGNRVHRRFELGNFNTQAVPIHHIRASDPRISMTLVFEDHRTTVTEEPVQELLPPQARAQLEVTVNSAGLELGPHHFEIHLLPVPDAPPLVLPIELEVREPDREDLDDRPERGEGRGRRNRPLDPPSEGPPPRLRFDRYVYDFGEAMAGEILRTSFEFWNDGEGPLLIRRIGSTCSCSVARLVVDGVEIPRRQLRDLVVAQVEPGKSGLLEVEVNTTRLGGDMSKRFTIHSNDPGQPMAALVVGAALTNPFVARPGSASFGSIRRSETPNVEVKVTSDHVSGFEIVGFESPAPPVVDVTFEKIPGNEEAWRVGVQVRPDAPFGRHVGTLKLAIEHERVKEMRLTYDVNVQPDVRFTVEGRPDEKKINFDIIREAPGGGISAVRKVLVVNLNPALPYPLRQVRVESRTSPDCVVAELIPIEEGVRYEVHLKVVKPPPVSFLEGKLIFECPDYAALPVHEMEFRGTWQRKRGTADGG